MLAYSSRTPRTWTQAASGAEQAAFTALARVHRDGWGVGWADEDGVHAVGAPDVWGPDAAAAAARPSARHGMLYLRFASAGALPDPANVQPFLAAGVAFQHNGALVPRDLALAGLAAADLAALRGTTDSEVYFRHLLAARATLDDLAEAAAHAARTLRGRFADACLNALAIDGHELVVIHSPGSRPTPVEAFARRGITGGALPLAHHAEDARTYHRLFARTADGIALVATSGIDPTGWTPLADDHVLVFRGGALSRRIRI